MNRRYDEWYEAYDESPKIQIDGDRLNFVEVMKQQKCKCSQNDQKEKLTDIREELRKTVLTLAKLLYLLK